ncbi:MAG: 4-amino-4-deoxy-L-arabinose transferase-like glycosyltransferase, partial [Myxococcota bacterium]
MARHLTDPRTHEVLDIKSAWLVFAVALAIRALELWELADTPLLEFVLGDAKNYVAWGRELAAGNWLGDETFYQAPLYPYFLGVLFSVFGDDLFAVRVFQLFMGSGSCVLIALAGARFFSPRAGLAAGLGMAVYGPAVYADAMIQKSVLDIFFVCLSLWLVSVMATRPSVRACLGLGMALGTMTLTRENALVFPVVLVPWLALALDADRRSRAAFAAWFVLGMALVLGPVAVRNWVVGGEFHLTTSQFGHNFYIGNNPAADGTYAPLIEGRGDPRVERLDAIELAEHALGKKLSPSEVSGFYTERALQFILGEPVDWLRLMLRKVLLVFTSTEMVDTEDQYTHAENSFVLTATGSLFHFGVLTPVALL